MTYVYQSTCVSAVSTLKCLYQMIPVDDSVHTCGIPPAIVLLAVVYKVLTKA